MKRYLSAAVCFLVFALSSCGGGGGQSTSSPTNQGSAPDPTDPSYYSTYADRAAVADGGFTDDFSGSVNASVWNVIDGKWHHDQGVPHNGVNSRNVSLVTEGNESYLALMGRGKYYKDEDSSPYGEELPEGACIVSKDSYGPGRYEIKMKALPREGAVSTMWTYMMKGSEAAAQHEIDIELGGTTNGTNYRSAWFTSWVTHTDTAHSAVDVSDDLYLNDGEWHVYTFDWYTEYNGTDKSRIDFFIDGKFYAKLDSNVPYYKMPLWVGVWFPPSWPGTPNFDRDYMYVDYVKHIPFDQYCEEARYNVPYTKHDPSELNIPVLTARPSVNWIANGGFEYRVAENGAPLAWERNVASSGDMSLESYGGGQRLAVHAGEGASTTTYIGQSFLNVFEGYTFNLTVDGGYASGSEGAVMIRFTNAIGNPVGDMVFIDLKEFSTSGEMSPISHKITVPARCDRMEIFLTASVGTAYFDNAVLTFLGAN